MRSCWPVTRLIGELSVLDVNGQKADKPHDVLGATLVEHTPRLVETVSTLPLACAVMLPVSVMDDWKPVCDVVNVLKSFEAVENAPLSAGSVIVQPTGVPADRQTCGEPDSSMNQ